MFMSYSQLWEGFLYKYFSEWNSFVDCSGRRADARGRKEQGRPHRANARGDFRTALRISEATGTEINRFTYLSNRKTATGKFAHCGSFRVILLALLGIDIDRSGILFWRIQLACH